MSANCGTRAWNSLWSGRRQGDLNSLRKDDHSPGLTKKEVRTYKLRTLHRLPSPRKPRGKSCGRLTRSAEMQGPTFHDPLARCSLALPSFLLLRNGRVGLVATINYIIYFPPCCPATNAGNDAPRGTDR